jgi:hypothetical protein
LKSSVQCSQNIYIWTQRRLWWRSSIWRALLDVSYSKQILKIDRGTYVTARVDLAHYMLALRYTIQPPTKHTKSHKHTQNVTLPGEVEVRVQEAWEG